MLTVRAAINPDHILTVGLVFRLHDFNSPHRLRRIETIADPSIVLNRCAPLARNPKGIYLIIESAIGIYRAIAAGDRRTPRKIYRGEGRRFGVASAYKESKLFDSPGVFGAERRVDRSIRRDNPPPACRRAFRQIDHTGFLLIEKANWFRYHILPSDAAISARLHQDAILAIEHVGRLHQHQATSHQRFRKRIAEPSVALKGRTALGRYPVGCAIAIKGALGRPTIVAARQRRAVLEV